MSQGRFGAGRWLPAVAPPPSRPNRRCLEPAPARCAPAGLVSTGPRSPATADGQGRPPPLAWTGQAPATAPPLANSPGAGAGALVALTLTGCLLRRLRRGDPGMESRIGPATAVACWIARRSFRSPGQGGRGPGPEQRRGPCRAVLPTGPKDESGTGSGFVCALTVTSSRTTIWSRWPPGKIRVVFQDGSAAGRSGGRQQTTPTTLRWSRSIRAPADRAPAGRFRQLAWWWGIR